MWGLADRQRLREGGAVVGGQLVFAICREGGVRRRGRSSGMTAGVSRVRWEVDGEEGDGGFGMKGQREGKRVGEISANTQMLESGHANLLLH